MAKAKKELTEAELVAEKFKKKIANMKKACNDLEVVVQCVCDNVHLGEGKDKLTAEQNSQGNWKNGGVAIVSKKDAKVLVENEQCEIL